MNTILPDIPGIGIGYVNSNTFDYMKKLLCLLLLTGFLNGCNKDEIAERDDIISREINTELISISETSIDFNNDNVIDLYLGITVNNKSGRPLGSFFGYEYDGPITDTLDVKIYGDSIYFLIKNDSSYVIYPIGSSAPPLALDPGDLIGVNNKWDQAPKVLRSFSYKGNFNGVGEKYLGIKFYKGKNHYYGWLKISCSVNYNTLKILEFGYNNVPGREIKAGQKY